MKHTTILVKVRFTTSIVVHVVHFEVWRLFEDGACSDLGVNRAAFIRGQRLFDLNVNGDFLTFHWVKSVRIWSFSGPYFPTFGPEKLRIRTRSVCLLTLFSVEVNCNPAKNIKNY